MAAGIGRMSICGRLTFRRFVVRGSGPGPVAFYGAQELSNHIV